MDSAVIEAQHQHAPLGRIARVARRWRSMMGKDDGMMGAMPHSTEADHD
jgi:hypothetical protein